MRKSVYGKDGLARKGIALSLFCATVVPSLIFAGTVPVGPNSSLVSLKGTNYRLRMSENFSNAALVNSKWSTRSSSASARDQARCVAEASIDDASAVSIDPATGELKISAWTVSTSTGNAVKNLVSDKIGSGKHRDHYGGGLITRNTLGYGYYETWVKPYLLAKGVHSAFWTFGYNGAGQNVIEIDGLEIDSGEGAVRDIIAPNPAAIAKSTKNLYVWLANKNLDLAPYSGAPHFPWQGRGNREFKLLEGGWIRSGFDYSPYGVRFFENGVEVSHTDFPAALPQINARHPMILSAKAGLGMSASAADIGASATSTQARTFFKQVKFYAADYLDVNILSNGDFEYNFDQYMRPVTSALPFALGADGLVQYDPVKNTCLKVASQPNESLAGTTYPIQWFVGSADSAYPYNPTTPHATVVNDPSSANPNNHVLKIVGPGDQLPNVLLSQTLSHINSGNYFLRGRVKRPIGYEEARLKVTYSTGPSATDTIYIPLPSYGPGVTPVYTDIEPVWINVADDGENTFVKVEIAALATTARSLGNSTTPARNSYNQDLVMYIDDLQLYKRSSSTKMPPRTSELPAYSSPEKLMFSNYASDASGARPHFYPSTVASADASDIDSKVLTYHLLDRQIGGVVEAPGDLTVSMDVYPGNVQDATFVAKMNALSATAKRGFAMGLRNFNNANQPYCAIGNLYNSAVNSKILTEAGTTPFTLSPYSSVGPKAGAKLTCTYKRTFDSAGVRNGTRVTLYVNGITRASADYVGFYHDYPQANATVGQYGHTSNLFSASGDITYSNGVPVTLNGVRQGNFVGYLGNVKVWNSLLSDAAISILGSAPLINY